MLRTTLVAPDATTPPDSAAFRRALGSFGTGVAVATCRDAAGQSAGITINSFTSVSLDPLLVLFCLGTTTRVHADFLQAEHFAINILATDQEQHARHFSSPTSGDWKNTPILPDTAAPILPDCLSWIICRRHAVHPGGDHTIIVGAVTALGPIRDTDPLLYFRGQYRRF